MRRAPIHNSQQIFVDLRYGLFCLGSISFSYPAYWDLVKLEKNNLALDSEADFILSPTVKPWASAHPQKEGTCHITLLYSCWWDVLGYDLNNDKKNTAAIGSSFNGLNIQLSIDHRGSPSRLDHSTNARLVW